MKFYYCLAILLITVTTDVISQNENSVSFPEDFFGIYTGTLHISSKSGESDIAMEFHLLPTDTLGQYQYTLVYGAEDKKQERAYTLKEKNRAKGEYILDENNGIILHQKVIENRMYTLFEVGDNLLTTFITFEENYMVFDITFAPRAQKNTTYATDKEKTEVISFPITTVQRAVLKKR